MHQVPNKLKILFLTMTLLLAASPACGGETVLLTAEQTQAHPTATSEATSTPKPTPVPPASATATSTPEPTPVPPSTPAATSTPIPPASLSGIDEPLIVADVEIQVLEAYTEDSLSAGDSTVYPDDPSDTFFQVVVDIGGGGNAFDWVVNNIRLTYGGEEYEMEHQGLKIGEDGKFAGTIFVFCVPKGSQLAGYALQLTDESSIALAPFFE